MNKLRMETERQFVIIIMGMWSYNKLPKMREWGKWNLTCLWKTVMLHAKAEEWIWWPPKFLSISIRLAESPHASENLFADTSARVTTAHTGIKFILNSLFHSELYLYIKIAVCKTLMRHNRSAILSVPRAELWSCSSRSDFMSQAIYD